MEILIQGNKLDVTLETEKNILQVIESLEEWFSNDHKIIDQIKVDDCIIEPSERKELEKRLISETNLVEISTNDKEEYAINSLGELNDYIDRFLYQLEKNQNDFFDNEKKEKIIEGLKWINEILFSICKILSVDINTIFNNEIPISDIISQNNIALVELETHKYNPTIFKEIICGKLLSNLECLKEYFPKILSKSLFHFSNSKKLEINNVNENLKGIISTIKAFIPIIPKIGTNLQTGKEREAFFEIKNVLSMMDNLVYHLRKVEELLQIKYSVLKVGENCVDDINKEFNHLLNQLSEALLRNDIVLLSDLLEYEIIDKLQIYCSIFEELIVITKKKSYN